MKHLLIPSYIIKERTKEEIVFILRIENRVHKKSMLRFPQKFKIRTTILLSCATSGHIPKGLNILSQNYCAAMFFADLFTVVRR